MTTPLGRILTHGAAVVLLIVLGGWLVTAMSSLGTVDAKNLDRMGAAVSSQPIGPTLTLDFYEGPAGTYINIKGSGYSDQCAGGGEFFYFDLIWDDELVESVESDECDYFSTDFQVPLTAAAGRHKIVGEWDDESAEEIFFVPPSPTLVLVPYEGGTDALFRVEGSGYSNCNFDCSEGGQSPQVEVVWTDAEITDEVISTTVMRNDGTFTAADVPVPDTATPGDYEVIGRFGTESAQETFFVLPPATLTVNPSEGPPGVSTAFTVRGSGYYTDDCLEDEFPSAEVFWDETTSLGFASVINGEGGGEFEADFSVPPGAATPGEHLVSALCGNENPSAIFTIPAAPVLTLVPDEGGPDSLFTVMGDGYSHCNYRCSDGDRFAGVEIIWASTGEVIATAVLSDEGTFTATEVPVSDTATPGDHEVIGRFGTESADATFIVPPSPIQPAPNLALNPYLGNPGSLVEVKGDGYSPCTFGECSPVEIFWGVDNEMIGIGTMGSDGRFSVNVNVPQAAISGNYQVLARFGTESAAATFSVVPPPVLRLNPHEGRSGTLFTIEGSGYGRCYGTCSHVSEVAQTSEVTVLWGANNDVLTTTEMRSDGTFTAEATVPSTAAPGEHFVIGRFGTERAGEFFTVEPPPIGPEIFDSILNPDSGRPGDFFRIEGSGYDRCPDRGNRVVNIYDRNVSDGSGFRIALARDVPVSTNGTFSAVVQVPLTALPGNHEINIQCFGGREYTSRIFTVIDPAAPIPGPPGVPPGSDSGDPPLLPEFPLSPDDVLPQEGESVKRAYLTTETPVLNQVFNHPMQILKALLLAFLLIFIVAFPAELFNRTYEENHHRIERWFEKWFPWFSKLSPKNQPSLIHINILGVFAAVLLLMAFVPDPAFDYATLAQALAYLFALPLVLFLLELSGELYSRWKGAGSTRPDRYKLPGPQWRIVPSALIVAGFLAVLSRVASFSPPYVYGLIAVYLGAKRLLDNLAENEKKEEEGRRVLVGVLVLTATSVIAWLIWSQLYPAVDQGMNGFGWLIVDAFLVTFFLIGLETVLFGLIPLTFLKGKDLWGWSRAAWAVVFLLIAFFFVNVQFAVREIADPTLPEMIKAIALFVVFGIASLLFWGYFYLTARSTTRNRLPSYIQKIFSRSMHR